MVEQRRVVVTGIGVVSPIGIIKKKSKTLYFIISLELALAKTIMILVLEVIFMEILI